MEDVYMYSTLLASFHDEDGKELVKAYVYRNMRSQVYVEFVREWVYGPASVNDIVRYIDENVSQIIAKRVSDYFELEGREQNCD